MDEPWFKLTTKAPTTPSGIFTYQTQRGQNKPKKK